MTSTPAPVEPITVTTTSKDATTDDEMRMFLNSHIWIVEGFQRRRLQHRRHEYSNLDEDWTLTSKVELQKRRVKVAQRDTALLNCSFFLRSSGEYTLLDHLPELGNRDSKQWFLVRHKDSYLEYILTVFPRFSEMILPFSTATVKTISELVLTLQHPYLQPMKELAFQMDVEHIITIYPYNSVGSLKDHIYTARCIDGWNLKYSDKGQPLEVPTVKLYGKQVLQALLFLKQRGFPFFGHLHSGNVIVVDNTCRLCGYENTLLSVPPKLRDLLRRSAKSDMKHFDVLCFGHLLYEMLTGFELDTAVPESRHYVLVHKPEVVEILQYIFSSQANEYPSIKKISQHAFFQHVKLKELDTYTTVQSMQPPPIKTMLKNIKKASPVKKRSSFVVVGENQTRKRSESQASISSKSSIGSSVASSSKGCRSSQRVLQLTTVLSESEKSYPPSDGQVHSNTSHGTKKEKESRSEVKVTEGTNERTALLSDIRRVHTLKKTGSYSKTYPKI